MIRRLGRKNDNKNINLYKELTTFLLIWFGQLISTIGTRITVFGLGVWIYQQTGSLTQLSLIYLCTYLPEALTAPFAGTIVDRYEHRWVMIFSDAIAGLSTLVIALLLGTGQLNLWCIYPIVAVRSSLNAFQRTAYTTAITILVPQQHFGRANGLVQFAKAISELAAPTLAGFLISSIQISGVLLVDVFSFLMSLIILLNIRFPKIFKASQQQSHKNLFISDIFSGYQYITQSLGLLELLKFSSIFYFTLRILEVVFTPLVLSFASTAELGVVLSIGGCGYLLGSLLISTWGGPKHQIYGVFGFTLWQGLFLFLGGLQPTMMIAAVGIFGYLFAYPIILSCNQAIWQSKVVPAFQGRVFGVRYLIEQFPSTISYLIAGPLVENIFEPALAQDGLLTGSIGQIIGFGTGRGIGLLLILLGLLHVLTTVVAYKNPYLLYVEDRLHKEA